MRAHQFQGQGRQRSEERDASGSPVKLGLQPVEVGQLWVGAADVSKLASQRSSHPYRICSDHPIQAIIRLIRSFVISSHRYGDLYHPSHPSRHSTIIGNLSMRDSSLGHSAVGHATTPRILRQHLHWLHRNSLRGMPSQVCVNTGFRAACMVVCHPALAHRMVRRRCRGKPPVPKEYAEAVQTAGKSPSFCEPSAGVFRPRLRRRSGSSQPRLSIAVSLTVIATASYVITADAHTQKTHTHTQTNAYRLIQS